MMTDTDTPDEYLHATTVSTLKSRLFRAVQANDRDPATKRMALMAEFEAIICEEVNEVGEDPYHD